MTDCNGSRPSIRIGSHDTTTITIPRTSLEDLEPSASCRVHFEIPCTIPNLRDLVKANDLNSWQRLNQSHLLEFVSHSRFGYIRKGRKQKWILWHVRSDLFCLASWKVASDATLLISPRPAEELWAWRCSPTFTGFRCRFFGSFGMPLISSDTHPAIISNGGVSQLQSSCPILSQHSKISQFRSPYIFTLSISPLALLLKFTSSWARVAASWASRPPVV